MDDRGIKCDKRVWSVVAFEMQQYNLNPNVLMDVVLLLQRLERMAYRGSILPLPQILLSNGRQGKLLEPLNAEYPRILLDIRGVLNPKVYVHEIQLIPPVQVALNPPVQAVVNE